MKVKIEKSVVVITPTIGLPELSSCVKSVSKQTYTNIHHLLVVDGPEYFDTVMENTYPEGSETINVCPFNTGAQGMYGHRIYAAYPHLINSDYIAFLDEDNWYDPTHIESLVNCIEENDLEWAHSLRKVYLTQKSMPNVPLGEDRFLAYDNCEAIGREPIWFTHQIGKPDYLVDTSTYLFKTEVLQKYCHLWHSGWGADRRFFNLIKHRTKYDTTGEHTLNYRLPNMQKAYGGDISFFTRGNEYISNLHNGRLPWKKTLSSDAVQTTHSTI